MNPQTYALILAGGAGTRFWPASRANKPKQLLSLLGPEPLIRETVLRVLPLLGGFEQVLIASGAHLVGPTAEVVPEIAERNVLVEPVPRNTAPCIAWAAARVARRDPEAVMMVLPSDHHIADVPRFQATLSRAVSSARQGTITTIGIRPTHPETGYGYIEVASEGAALGEEARAVRRFVEKPPRSLAEAFVASGNYLWNAGMFFFRVIDMLEAIRAHLPALSEGLEAINRAAEAGREAEAVQEIFPTLPSVSIDKGVMEHMSSLAVVPGDFGWSDVGSWHSAWELSDKDASGNAVPEGTLVLGSRNNQVVDLRRRGSKERVIALVGVEDLVVVETDDALLIVPRERAQEVKDVVEHLKARGDTHLI